jgi:hypothetical protein
MLSNCFWRYNQNKYSPKIVLDIKILRKGFIEDKGTPKDIPFFII